MIIIDGSQGEGGGQILRTALALSLVTGQPFRLERIRAGRQKPGLLRQHLTAVEAARVIGSAEAVGAAPGTQTLEFRPGPVRPGDYRFAVGTAGSATLVLQTVLPPLLVASGPSTLRLEGGTHNPFAPPFDFLARSFVPVIERMGPQIQLELRRPGFFPVGGGAFEARITPVKRLGSIELRDCGEVQGWWARAMISKLPSNVAERELASVREALGWDDSVCSIEQIANSAGPGNALLLELEAEHITAVFTAFGERGRAAEEVGRAAAAAARAWLSADVPVEEHLADQLLLPMALAGAGSFRTTEPSLHSTTNASIIERFLPVSIQFEREGNGTWTVAVNQTNSPRHESAGSILKPSCS